MSGKEDQRVRGHLAHLGASGLLIGRDTELGAIHHGPLRPIDNFYDSTLLLIPCNWTHPLFVKVSPLAWERGVLRMLGQRQRGRHGKDQTHPKQTWARRASIVGNKYSLPARTQMGNTFGDRKNVRTRLFPFLGKAACSYSWWKNKPSEQQHFCKEYVCWTCLGFINELCKERKDEEAKKGERSKRIAGSGSDHEGLQARDTAPEGQLQQQKRRCGFKSPETVLKITNPCQTNTYS